MENDEYRPAMGSNGLTQYRVKDGADDYGRVSRERYWTSLRKRVASGARVRDGRSENGSRAWFG